MAGTPTAADLQRLVTGLGEWVSRFARALRRAVVVVAVILAGTAVVALALGLWAWGDTPLGVLVVLVLTLPGVAAPVVSARRTRALAAAAADPAATTQQARSLFARVRSGTELSTLVDRALTLERGSGRTIRGLWRAGRALGAVVASVRPDPETEPLLLAFEPVRLRSTWWFLLASIWMWLVSLTLCFVAGLSVAIDLVT